MTDVRKAVTATDPSSKHKRPSMARRHTPVAAQKLGRSHREREREYHESWEDERESFPQFWYVLHFLPNFNICTNLSGAQHDL